jgi:spore germination cell wall hydrolase CwlJ-like protein
VAAGLAALALTAYVPKAARPSDAEQRRIAAEALAPGALARLSARMTPSALALAARHDPLGRHPDLWNRPEGWASLDLREVPTLGAAEAVGQTAEQINELRPFAGLPIRPMKPFVLQASGADRARALNCLSQAVYYEAAREPELGQEAVAQVVLNRVRHPAYPKSVCGVVYQGAARATGCQFTFTCDGALRYAPQPALWRRAQDVAARALAGYVDKQVGSATHYHARYVAPYWAPTLVKMTQVGQHIFYRWTGPWGEPAAFTGRYAGGEATLSKALLASYDPRTQGLLGGEPAKPEPRKVTLTVAGEARTYTVAEADPGAPRAGVITAVRRQPTADEIRKINEGLAAFERGGESPAPAASQD